MRAVLQLPAYRRLLVAYALNELAWSVGSLALAFLIYRRTGSALGSTAFFLSSQFVPALVSPLLVARLEHLRVRRALPTLYALEGLLFLALAWVAGRFSVAAVLVLALLDGILALTARPLARATTVAVTTEAGLLPEGNALTNTVFSVCFMAGPALGGAVVVAGGASAALLANTALFAAIALTLVTARSFPEPAAPERERAARRLRAALAYARERPAIRNLLSLRAAALLFFTLSIPGTVVFATHSLHAGAGGYGALLSSWGAGAIAGSAIYARWRRGPGRELIAMGSLALGAGFLVTAVAPSLVVAIVGSVVAGVGNGIESVAVRTLFQQQVEQRWMAIMMSFIESLDGVLPGAGIVIGGAITTLAGPRAALGAGGVGSLVIAAAVWVVLRPRTRRSGPALEPAHPDGLERAR